MKKYQFITLSICLTIIVVAWLMLLGWIATPTDFAFDFSMDNNTVEVVKNYNNITEKISRNKNCIESASIHCVKSDWDDSCIAIINDYQRNIKRESK